MNILKSATVRWIVFLPIFMLSYILTITLATFILTKAYEITFPINGFLDFLFSSIGITLIMTMPLFYASALTIFMKLCPNYRIGSWISFFVIVPVVSFGYFTQVHDYSIIKIKMQAALDIVTLLTLLLMAYNGSPGD